MSGFTEESVQAPVETPVETSAKEESFDSWDDAESYTPEETVSEENIEETPKEPEDSSSEVPIEEASEQDSEDSEEGGQDTGEAEQPVGNEEPDSSGEVREELINLKVDGEMQQVSLEDLKSNYSGKVAYDKKFTELDQERQSFKKEYEEIEGYINSFGEKMQSGDAVGAMEFFAQFSNMAPHQVRFALLQSLKPEYDRLGQMSVDEINSEYSQLESGYYKEQLESNKETLESQQASMELQKQEQSWRETHKIDVEEWSSIENTLKEQMSEETQITPELVKDYVLENRMYVRAESAIETVDATLLTDDTIVETLKHQIEINPTLTDDDIVTMVKNAVSIADKEETSSKLADKVQSKGKPVASEKEEDYSSPAEEQYLEDLFS